jgi:hypothetical protein
MRMRGMSLHTCQYIIRVQRDFENTYRYDETKELADHPPRVNTEKPLVNRISRQATSATTEL